VLVSRSKDELTESARQRLEALVESNDGFALAEKDLDIRNTGQLLGLRQSGASDLRFADFKRDRPLLERARSIALRSPAPLESPG
jgi:ATP-dependent DNA helicase RecG